MYRAGIPAKTISAETGVAQSVIRHHLAIAATQDPGLRDAHRSAAGPVPTRVTVPGRRNMEDVLAFHQAEGRLPVHGRSPRETALAEWLVRRRKDAANGTLSPVYTEGLDTIPGWRDYPTKLDTDATRWTQRFGELAAYLAAGHELPRHNKTDDGQERTLGVWLHSQRITARAGKLDSAKEKQLNETIPGWRQGRARRGANSRPST